VAWELVWTAVNTIEPASDHHFFSCISFFRRQHEFMRAPSLVFLGATCASVVFNSCAAAGPPRLEEETFGTMPDGTVVKVFTLRNARGMSARVITYGAILAELNIPDRRGATTNVVLGAKSLDNYLHGFRGPAAIIGRVANRIGGAKFALDGVEYRLSANNGPNHLHGPFGKVVWEGRALPPGTNTSSVRFSYLSRDGEDGMPGNVRVSVTYTVNDRNELRLDYEAATDKATPINLTSHAYFNLAGHGDVLGHEVWLGATRYTPADEGLIPTGEIASVAGTPLDFTKPSRIGARIAQLKPKPGGYDHNFVLDKPGLDTVAARVSEPVSGRVMEVRTTEPGVQFFTANHLNHAALCLETQHFPDSVNHPNFPSIILRAGARFQSTTVFAFVTR
jgi:aldose 1-epimerase